VRPGVGHDFAEFGVEVDNVCMCTQGTVVDKYGCNIVTLGDKAVHHYVHEELVRAVGVKICSFKCPDRPKEVSGNSRVR
jgi:hypothetical protein